MKPPTFGARLAKGSTRIPALTDPNETQPLSCFSIDAQDPQFEELARELEQALETAQSVVEREEPDAPLAAQPQPDRPLVEPTRR